MNKILPSGKKRVLVVESDLDDQQSIASVLTNLGYKFVCVGNLLDANKTVERSITNNQDFDLAIVNLRIGSNSGEDLIRRIMDILRINVICVNDSRDPNLEIPFECDELVMKIREQKYTLIEAIHRGIYDHPKMRPASRGTTLRWWRATEHMTGINSLSPFTFRVSEPEENVEKIILRSRKDRVLIPTVIYPQADNPEINTIAVSPLSGCPICCTFCKNWRGKKVNGKEVPYVRKLTADEIGAQIYWATRSPRIQQSFDKDVPIVVNFTVEGDGLAFNLDNCAEVIRQLSKIEKMSFIMTSVGREASLRRYIDKYLDLPVRHYWSLNFLNETRIKFMPGTRGESLTQIRDLYDLIARHTLEQVTVSWIVIKGVNDRPEDAKKLVRFLQGKMFHLKLMALVPGSLEDVDETTDADVEVFRQRLLKEGMEASIIRSRKILGIRLKSGCGNTRTDEWATDSF